MGVRVLAPVTSRPESDAVALSLVRALRIPEDNVERVDVSGAGSPGLERDLAQAHLADLARRTGAVALGFADKTGLALEPQDGARASPARAARRTFYRSDVVALARMRNTMSPVVAGQEAFAGVRVPAVEGLDAEFPRRGDASGLHGPACSRATSSGSCPSPTSQRSAGTLPPSRPSSRAFASSRAPGPPARPRSPFPPRPSTRLVARSGSAGAIARASRTSASRGASYSSRSRGGRGVAGGSPQRRARCRPRPRRRRSLLRLPAGLLGGRGVLDARRGAARRIGPRARRRCARHGPLGTAPSPRTDDPLPPRFVCYHRTNVRIEGGRMVILGIDPGLAHTG